MLGAAVALQKVVARTPDLVIAVVGVVGYPQGFEFSCLIRHRLGLPGTGLIHGGGRSPGRPSTPGGLSDDQFRIGVQFADGTKATNVAGIARRHAPDAGEQRPGAVMTPMGGGGGGHSWSQRMWVWPLPPPGPLSFVTEWPSEGVELSRVDVDAEAIRSAADGAEVLWPADEGGAVPPGGVTWGSGRAIQL